MNAELKHQAIQILQRTLASIDVRQALLRRVRREGASLLFPGLDGKAQDAITIDRPPLVVAFGKAAVRMAHAMREVLDGRIGAGLVVAPGIPEQRRDGFRYLSGGHPYPNEGSRQGAAAALAMVSGLNEQDLVIFLISGGGSALFEQPLDPDVTLDDLVQFNRVLVTCGLPIEQINVLRKHVSAVKGGRLALAASPADQLTVYISDVPDGADTMVASGPTFPDPSTVSECYALTEQYGLASELPRSIRRRFAERSLLETPKPGDNRFSRSHYCRLLSNRDAMEAAKAEAEKLGFLAEVDTGSWDVDFREAAQAQSAALDDLASRHHGRRVCLVAGGEVISRVTGPGVGGRNQAFAVYAAGLIAGRDRAVLSAGTDGRDGNSPASGAVADGGTIARAREQGLDPARCLAESDSYHFFQSLGDTIETGYTDNNVRDVRLWLA